MNRLTDIDWDRAAEGAHVRMTQAWAWLCEQRTQAPDEADIWDARYQQAYNGAWLTDLTHRVLCGEYRLAPLQLQGKNANRKAVWGAQDALVLKWTALSLQHLLPLHASCEHVKGHGGGKPSIATLHHLLTQADDAEKKMPDATAPQGADRPATRGYTWVCRTDIRGYYRNINKQTLLNQVRQHVQSPVLRDLVAQYVHYTVEDGGTFHTPEAGISRGCPLSPLMGALHLYDMDEHFAKQRSIHYARYMDDIIILAKSRWSLRRHTKRLMQWFSEYGFEAHPDKTQIGRTEKGFDWMGAWLTHEGVKDIAPRAKANHREKVRRLYERLARVPLWARKREKQRVHAKVSRYRKRWNIWAGALLCVAGAACADSPLVILASGNIQGDTGARYPFDASVDVNGNPKGIDYGGLCLSGSAGGCIAGGYMRARLTPIGFGFELKYDDASAFSNLVLVPYGTLSRTNVSADEVRVMDLNNGHVTYGDGSLGTACSPVDLATLGNFSWFKFSKATQCPNKIYQTFRSTGTLTAQGYYVAYAMATLQPGSLGKSYLYFGLHAEQDFTAGLPKPTAIIISGLNCNIQVTDVSGATASGIGSSNVGVDLGDVRTGLAAGTSTASASIVLTTACSGANSSDASAQTSIATTFNAGPGTQADASGFLRETGVTGHYLTLNQNSGACNTSNAVTGTTTGTTYAPGAPGTVSTETVVASLCSDGTTETLGEHNISAVAELVNR